MSPKDLATASGVSVGMISQVERGQANPSIRLLTALRRALNLTMQELFGEARDAPSDDAPFVRRLKERPRIDLGPIQKELLTSGGQHNLQITILKFAPGAHSGGHTLSYPAEKGGMVLSGEVVLTVDGIAATLRTGDSFAFDSALPHSIQNNSTGRAEVLWIIGAVQFDRHL